jgi:Domain of unknown function (DUF4365)
MPADQEWFIGERARALALLLLTRRTDLEVLETKDDYGLDFVVLVRQKKKSSARFGVWLRGSKSSVDVEHANKVLRPSVRSFQRLGHYPFSFPVCLFFFTMEDEEGYYAWLMEPLIDPQKGVSLHVNEEADCKKLSNKALDEIVTRVQRWFDHLIVSTA